MATTDAKAFPFKNTAYRVTFPILDADGDLVAGATGLDSEISKDAGTFTDCTNEATQILTSSGIYYLDLTSTEMNADTVAVIVKSTEGKTTALVFYPLEAGDITANVVQWAGTANTTSDIAIKTTLAKTTHITGFNDISTANVQTELTTYGALKPTTAGRTLDITTTGEAGIDWANIGAPTTVVGLSGTTVKNATDVSAYVDTEVGAIKAVTDKLDTAMEIDGAVYRFTQNALELAPSAGLQGNGGTLRFDDVWKWTTAGSVSSGQIRGNVTDWNTITQLWIHTVTNGGTNLGAYLRVLTTNDTIRVQQENNVATWNSYIVTGTITDNTTWISVPVALRTGASVGPPATATNCLVSFFRPNAQDWTDTEKSQIRYRVGIDGTAATPSATPTLALQSTSTAIKTVTDKLDTAMVVDGAVYQYTANALELGPAGGGGGGDASQATLLAVKAKTDALPSDPADQSDLIAQFAITNGKVDAVAAGLPLDTTELNAIADTLLKRDWTAVTGEASFSVLQALRMLRNSWSSASGVLTVKKEDGTTNAWSRPLAVDPTAQPIIGAS